MELIGGIEDISFGFGGSIGGVGHLGAFHIDVKRFKIGEKANVKEFAFEISFGLNKFIERVELYLLLNVLLELFFEEGLKFFQYAINRFL